MNRDARADIGREVDVVIVGAGVAGLTLAFLLRRAELSVAVLEESGRIGGSIETVNAHGCLLEHGANSTLATPALLELIAELRLTEMTLPASQVAKNRYLVTDRASSSLSLVAAPRSLRAAIGSPLISSRAKLRALCEPFIRKSPSSDETVASLFRRRFGPEVSDRIVAAVLSGVWAGDTERLSARCAVRRAWEAEQASGSIMLGLMKQRRANPPAAPAALKGSISFRGGMSTLPRALAAAIGADSILLNHRVEEFVEAESGHLDVRVLQAGETEYDIVRSSHVVVTTPAKSAAHLLRFAAPALARTIETLPYAPVGLLYLKIPREAVKHPLDGFGFLVPPMFHTALRGALFSSSLFPDRAPEDAALITCFVGGAPCPEASDVSQSAIQARVLDEITPLLGFRRPPEIVGAHAWQRAIPNYPLGHHTLQRAVDDLHEADCGVSILANWDRGISVADRISEAQAHAAHVLKSSRLQHGRAQRLVM